MKTTINIQDDLLERARRKARRQGRTMRSLIEEGLRRVLDAEPYRLVDLSVGEPGSPDPLASISKADLRDEIYGGR